MTTNDILRKLMLNGKKILKDVIITYNLMVRFLKFTLNIKIYDEFVEFLSKPVWRETLFTLKLLYLHALSPTKGWYYIGIAKSTQTHLPTQTHPLK